MLLQIPVPGTKDLQALQADYGFAALRVRLKAISFRRLVGKAGFNPNQPRVPRGNPDGGRWTDTGAGGGRVQLVGGRRRGGPPTIRIGGRELPASLRQITALAVARVNATSAIARARQVDPSYRPSQSLYQTVEGAILHYQGQARDAIRHVDRLQAARFGNNQGPRLDPLPPEPLPVRSILRDPETLVSHYREIIGVSPVPGGRARSKAEGTVALGEMDGKLYFGVNSSSPGYTQSDLDAAKAMRDRLIISDPDIMQSRNTGWKPNDALFHAEATLLLRAATKNGGTLTGKTIAIRVDRYVCRSCQVVLPRLSKRLGNPKIEIIEPRGRVWLLVNGKWVKRPI